MALVKKSITVTAGQEQWIRTQVASGEYGNDSEYVRDLIRRGEEKECAMHDRERSDSARSGERHQRGAGEGDLGGGRAALQPKAREAVSLAAAYSGARVPGLIGS